MLSEKRNVKKSKLMMCYDCGKPIQQVLSLLRLVIKCSKMLSESEESEGISGRDQGLICYLNSLSDIECYKNRYRKSIILDFYEVDCSFTDH